MRGRKTGGRRKGTPNKINRDLREMLLTALHQAGGVKYLTACAKDSPAVFLALLAKILPKESSAADRDDPDAGKLVVEIIGGLPKPGPGRGGVLAALAQPSRTQTATQPTSDPNSANPFAAGFVDDNDYSELSR